MSGKLIPFLIWFLYSLRPSSAFFARPAAVSGNNAPRAGNAAPEVSPTQPVQNSQSHQGSSTAEPHLPNYLLGPHIADIHQQVTLPYHPPPAAFNPAAVFPHANAHPGLPILPQLFDYHHPTPELFPDLHRLDYRPPAYHPHFADLHPSAQLHLQIPPYPNAFGHKPFPYPSPVEYNIPHPFH